MKRFEINKALKELEAMCMKENCHLPPFCNFTPAEWQSIGHEYDEVRNCMLGWDITHPIRRKSCHASGRFTEEICCRSDYINLAMDENYKNTLCITIGGSK